MRIALYEEFPTEENLEKIVQIDFPTEVIVAVSDLRQFEKLERQIKYTNSHVQRVGYWPVISREEGYWLSPFSKRSALEMVISELENRASGSGALLVHWDAELPILNKRLFFVDPKFFSNRRRIIEFLMQHKDYGLDLVTSEMPTVLMPEALQRCLGVAFDPGLFHSEKVRMIYTSLIKGYKIPDNMVRMLLVHEAKKGLMRYGDRFGVAIGCLATGIFGNEPLMTPNELESDLNRVQSTGVTKVFVYRLGGINPDMASTMRRYAK